MYEIIFISQTKERLCFLQHRRRYHVLAAPHTIVVNISCNKHCVAERRVVIWHAGHAHRRRAVAAW